MSRQGRFVWFELLTTDTAAAPSFYGPVVGLTTQPFEGMDYTMWAGEAGPIGGLATLPEAARSMGAPPHWLGYVSVPDVRATAERVSALGGGVILPPTDLPNGAGSFAIFADPQGAVFGVHSGANEGDAPEPKKALGEFGWAELGTRDADAAFAFYSELFGWTKTTSIEMGPEMGVYQLFGREGQPDIGGMMRLPPGAPAPAWLHYTRVADCDAAHAKALELGAQTLYPPMDIPGGGRATLVMDPQGAAIGFFAEPNSTPRAFGAPPGSRPGGPGGN